MPNERIEVPARVEDLTGRVFDRLTVLWAEREPKYNQIRWRCQCKCDGNTNTAAAGYDLRNGITTSCGCRQVEAIRKTAKGNKKERVVSLEPEYKCWSSMVGRCTQENHPDYKDYGGAGITVCDRWLDYDTFKQDMGDRPSLKHSLDRYPNKTGNYEPGNVRWATWKQQGRNKTTNRPITCFGVTLLIVEWADLTGLRPSCVSSRLDNLGWSPEETFSTPSEKQPDKFIDPRPTLTAGISEGFLYL